jgi:hypothetical protein
LARGGQPDVGLDRRWRHDIEELDPENRGVYDVPRKVLGRRLPLKKELLKLQQDYLVYLL